MCTHVSQLLDDITSQLEGKDNPLDLEEPGSFTKQVGCSFFVARVRKIFSVLVSNIKFQCFFVNLKCFISFR